MISDISLSHRKEEPESGVLYIVGTPIGNLDDISKRVVNILKRASLIACEDTRKTKKLLNHLSIKNKLLSFHKYSSGEKCNFFISMLKEGASIALVSDAGMPSISDPGNFLIRKAKENNIDVICIPGPCAAITALVSSGIDSSRFTFYGFMPRSTKERNKTLKIINESDATSIIYESPKRILKLLNDLKVLIENDREIVVLKELTKKYEKHFGYEIDSIIKEFEGLDIRGEFTLVIGANKRLNKDEAFIKDLKEDLNELIKAGLSHSAAANYLSKKSRKPKNEIYKLILNNELE
tara:strand:+ start:204 stop:1085 length:882 start_codon:yes stop_codon:yes gene_type:complete